MSPCEICNQREHKYSYSDPENGIGKPSPYPNRELLPIAICEVCLHIHLVEYWPGSANHLALLDEYPHLEVGTGQLALELTLDD